MGFAPEGRPFLLATGALALVVWLVALSLGRRPGWLLVLAGVTTLVFAFVAYFFRDPERTSSAGPEVVLSPADGRVLSVSEVEEPTFFGGPARRISIFLSVFDVHVQRSPLAGTVRHKSYRPGAYAVAWEPKASESNEQASLGIDTPQGPVLVRQIAGLVARRIVTYPNEGDALERGQRIGIIRFGSRVDLFVPLEWDVVSREGDVVRGGLTPLARTVRSEAAAAGGTP
jgi:phosphatidylserine decarboxylase